MNKKEIVTLKVAKELFETEFNEWCDASYAKNATITDYAYKKYGELSDDGFYSLTKQGGGDEPWHKIYDQRYRLCTDYKGSNKWFKKDKMRAMSAPTVFSVQTFLREKGIITGPVYKDGEFICQGEEINKDEKEKWTLISRKKYNVEEFFKCFDECLLKALKHYNETRVG